MCWRRQIGIDPHPFAPIPKRQRHHKRYYRTVAKILLEERALHGHRMRTIGAISDTHGLLRPQALAVLAGCDPIIHAGDIGSPHVLARLGALAPVHAVRGNVDHGAWSAHLPVTQRIEIDGFRIYVLHILADLNPQAADNVDAVIYGHSHQPKIETKNGTLFLNPGSAGPRRFRLPITVGRMTAEHGKLHAEIVELSVER
jgi:uncharacterized protein